MKALDFNTFKKLRHMSFNQFNRWIASVYESGYRDALTANREEIHKRLLAVPGIGEKRAEEVEKALWTDIEKYPMS